MILLSYVCQPLLLFIPEQRRYFYPTLNQSRPPLAKYFLSQNLDYMKRNGTPLREGLQPLLTVVPKKAGKALFYIAFLLLILNLAGIFLQTIGGYDNFFIRALVGFFDMSEENNIPSLFSALILFIASSILFILYLIYDQKSIKFKIHWLLLSCIFLFLSVDEAISIHEKFNRIKSLMSSNYSGYLDYPWILPYGVFASLVGLFFFKFLLHLPAKTRKAFIISGCLYVFATIGFEPIEGHVIETYGIGYQYYLFCSLEEFLEMCSIILFNYTLLNYTASFNPLMKVWQKRDESAFTNLENRGKTKADKPLVEHTERF